MRMSYNDIIKLNVGGTRFMTTRQTLMRQPSSVLGRMFDIDSPFQPAAKLEDGAYFLDRDPVKFTVILNFLREDDLPKLSLDELKTLRNEARYFQLNNLEEEIDNRLDKLEVYKFKYTFVNQVGDKETDKFSVKKSTFGNVPHCAIVNFVVRNIRSVKAFTGNLMSSEYLASDENETIIVSRFSVYCSSLEEYIENSRKHLLLLEKSIRTKQISFKISDKLFDVNLKTALKDPQSALSLAFNDKQSFTHIYVDRNGNIEGINICLHLNKEWAEKGSETSCSHCGKHNKIFDYGMGPGKPLQFSTEEKLRKTLTVFESWKLVTEHDYRSTMPLMDSYLLYNMHLVSWSLHRMHFVHPS